MPSLWDALRQYLRDAGPGGVLNPEATPQGLLDTASLASAPVPIAGDIIGLLADANRMRDPSERTATNFGLMALGALPLVPSGLGKAKKALSKIDDAKRAKTKYEIAHEVAQRNAALPFEKGGLGLPPNNTAMDRAREMGFVDAYHGSNREVEPSFDMQMLGENTGAQSATKAVFAASDQLTPNAYIWGSRETSMDYYGAKIRERARAIKASTPGISDVVSYNRAKFQLQDEMADEFRLLNLDVINNSFGGAERQKRNPEYLNAVKKLNTKIAHDSFLTRGFNVLSEDDLMSKVDADALKAMEFVPYSNVDTPAPNIMPLMIRANDLPQSMMNGAYRDASYADILDYALKHGAEGAVIRNTTDGGPVTDIFAVSNPSRIRSRFAAFDPMKRDSADLLASIAPYAITGGLLGLLGLPDDAQAGK